LQETYAQRVGMDDALYVPSGTMANQLAIRVLGRPGSLVVAGRRSHVVAYEHAAAAWNAGVQLHPIDDSAGAPVPSEVGAVISGADHHQPTVSLLCLENTHMANGGTCTRPATVQSLAALGVPVHVDGARLFNAEVATGIPARELIRGATTVMSCLSKGLAAPVGSLLAGPAAVVSAAREERARLGGGMRQAGIIAAAGLVALRDMVSRLSDDHRRAKLLAEAVVERWPSCGLEPATVETNIVVFRHDDPGALLEHLAGCEVLAGTIAPQTVRLVTHVDVDDAGLEQAARALAAAP
jgi:threonine aldolase